MSTWFLLALSAPILWGFGNVTDAAVRRHYIKNDWVILWLTLAVHMVGVTLFFIFVDTGFAAMWAPLALVGAGTLWSMPLLVYYRSLAIEETSRVALFLQLQPIFGLLLAFFFLGEILVPVQSMAFVLILVGGSLAAIHRTREKWRFSLAFWLILLAGFFWSVGDVIFKYLEPQFSSFYSAFAFFYLGAVIPALFMPISAKLRRSIRKYVPIMPLRGWVLLVSGVIAGALGSLFFVRALVLGPIALTAVMIGAQPFFVMLYTLILSRFVKEVRKEDFSRQALTMKGISLVLVLVGLVLLNL